MMLNFHKNKLCQSCSYHKTYAVNNERVYGTHPLTQGPYILQLFMGPSYFWRGLLYALKTMWTTKQD